MEKQNQYAALTDPVVGLRIRDPFKANDSIEIEAWHECHKIANKVMKEEIHDPTNGAMFFHDKSITSEEFISQVPRAVFEKQIGDLFFYIIRK